MKTPRVTDLDSAGDGRVLWTPPHDASVTTRMGRYMRWLAERGVTEQSTYDGLWHWSVTHSESFWRSIQDHFDVISIGSLDTVLEGSTMPDVRWFPQSRLNYAEHALRHSGDRTAVVATSHTRGDSELTFDDLHEQVARAATGLRRLGVTRGDRVAAYAPNVPETLVLFLAAASLGAVWSSCAPEFGVRSVIERFQQIEPTVLFVVDGYLYGNRTVRRDEEVRQIRSALPSVRATIVLPYLREHLDHAPGPDALPWDDLLAEREPLEFDRVPFDHPLYVLYSSGTTGLPKAIVHGHGGILLEHLKMMALHHDLGPGDRFFWFSTTGWMMWNYLVSGLLVGSSIVLFDGNPAHPDLSTLWRLAARTGVTYFGVSAPFLISCRKQGLSPDTEFDLSAIRGIGSTGAPLPAEDFAWVYEAVGRDLILGSASGGTDVCTAVVGPCPLLPVRAGEIQTRMLGASVEAWGPDGTPLIGQRGELVITRPMPSMPVFFWGDDDGSRYREAYFEMFPGVWRHGDWVRITEHGGAVITGRSDATLNRGGVRMGTSEYYRVVEGFPEVTDSLVVHLDDGSTTGQLVLFVQLTGGVLDDALRSRLLAGLRTELSPRHVPDEMHQIPQVPRTLSGKKLEIPVKRILSGTPVNRAAGRDALANPKSLDWFAMFAAGRGSPEPGDISSPDEQA